MSPQGRDGVSAQVTRRPQRSIRRLAQVSRSTDSYALVLVLIVLDYLAVSVLYETRWGHVIVALLLGATLLLTLYTSRAHRGVILLGWIVVACNALLSMLSALAPVDESVTVLGPAIGAILLIGAPMVILRRIATHSVVTAQTIFGAIDVYLLFGMIFAVLYSGLDAVGSGSFFVGVARAMGSDYLFFSYSTLTTVGYGNLVPAGHLGQTMAMFEALSGQIFLVIVVARLVSLWGQVRPTRHDHFYDQTKPEP